MQLKQGNPGVRDGKQQASPCNREMASIAPIFAKHKPPSESPAAMPPAKLTLREKMKCAALMPLAKAAQLYGMDEVSAPARRIVERTEAFKQAHPVIGRIAEVVSWAGIGFAMAQAGSWLSGKLRGIGSTLSDMVGYTVACAHPSAVAIGVRRLFKVKNSGAGISRYLEASVVGYAPAAPVFFATLGALAHSSSQATVSTGTAVAAAVGASLATFATWSSAFTAYWVRVVRGEKGNGIVRNSGEFLKGFVDARKFGKGKVADGCGAGVVAHDSAARQAGEIVGTSFIIWALPWYTLRAAAAFVGGMKGLEPAAFTKFLVTAMCTLEGVDILLSGLETTIVEKILKRKSKEAPGTPGPKPKSQETKPKTRDTEQETGHGAQDTDELAA